MLIVFNGGHIYMFYCTILINVDFQIALVDTLRSMGLTPDGIIGHSVGELGCAYADGGLTAAETILAAYWRGRCVKEANLPPGRTSYWENK